MSERRWTELTTLGDLLVRGAALRADTEALVLGPARHTYRSLLEAAERSARSLLGLGVSPGERIGILMPNCVDFVETLFACWLLGVRPLTINARYKPYELAHVLRDAEVTAVVTTDLIAEHVDFVALLDEAVRERPPALRSLVVLGDGSPAGWIDRGDFEEAAAGATTDDVHRHRGLVRIRDEGILLYTSGTTASPRGCVLTHEALAWTSSGIAERWRLTEADRLWAPLPMFHMGGILPLLSIFQGGGTDVSMTYFEPGEGLRLLAGERCTFAWPAFPPFTQGLIHHPDFEATDLSRVRLVLDTGQPDTIRDVQAHFPRATVVTVYGLTECAGLCCIAHPDDPLEQRITGGRPLHGAQVIITDPETGREVAPGEVGEITIAGPCLFERYQNDPEKTAEALRGGWLHTGDLGKADEDGRIAFAGRLKDMLKVGGENVAAAEIEAFLGTHPAVKIAQVVGVPDDYYVEVPAAFVELAPGAGASAEELVEFCRGKISSFKIPRYIRFVTDWPLSATKIQKFPLREQLLAEFEREGAHA